MVMMMPFAVKAALAVKCAVAIVVAGTVDDHVVVIAVVVPVDVNVAAAPVKVATVILRGRGRRGQNQANGDQGWNANRHVLILKGVCPQDGRDELNGA
ncbi:hypothetical protein JHFBIEKO_0217 [Methylobacterium mesophilicum]|nr:hypothetical protein JHFBIEKO_0217 [Methylobacterium mesophilicum]